MNNKLVLPLNLQNKKLFIYENHLVQQKQKLETFLDDEKNINDITFAKKVLLTNEVQSNNSIEGYNDDLNKIISTINKSKIIKKEVDNTRILNLHDGYKYILEGHEINKENLKILYSILSKNLLDEEDLKNMGQYYREKPVYIHHSNNPNIEPLMGMNENLLDEYMDNLFNYINTNTDSNSPTDEFIKSQIIHFYFVYIHPYFDINGRTARTSSIWHLLNKEAYPYVIFNRGIKLNKSEYYKVLMDVRKFSNMTFFINYMLKTVLIELQKEHVIQDIKSISNNELTTTDYQTIHYLLSTNGILSLCDFANMYNRFNNKKHYEVIYKDMIEPLLDKNILLKDRETTKMINNDIHNFIIKFNPKYIDNNPIKTGELNIKKTIR